MSKELLGKIDGKEVEHLHDLGERKRELLIEEALGKGNFQQSDYPYMLCLALLILEAAPKLSYEIIKTVGKFEPSPTVLA